MPRIRMLTAMASADWALSPGDVVERPVEVAAAWVAAGLAEWVDRPSAEPAEAAAISPPETAALPRPAKRRG